LNWKKLVLILLIFTGFILHLTGVFDWRQIFERFEPFSGYWWVWILILGTKVILYALAMPGSSLIWIAAILYEPLQATLLITFGGTLGGFLGYYVSKRATRKEKFGDRDSVFFGFLQKHGNFFALCAVRIMPGFPHSVINYGSGVLSVPWPKFLLATIAGFSAKGFVYSSVIHEAVEVAGISELGQLKTLWPLLILAGLMMIGHVFQKVLNSQRKKKNNP